MQDFTNKNLSIAWSVAAVVAGLQEPGCLMGAAQAALLAGTGLPDRTTQAALLAGTGLRCSIADWRSRSVYTRDVAASRLLRQVKFVLSRIRRHQPGLEVEAKDKKKPDVGDIRRYS